MKKLPRYWCVTWAPWLISAVAASVLVACAGGPLAPLEPIPGNGPKGKPMPTSTDIVAGLPAHPQTQLIYPITARSGTSDDYNGQKVDDPYRWLENLDSPATRDWVAAQNKVAQPRLDALPHRVWVKQVLTQLWNYERFNTPVKEGGRYFYLRNSPVGFHTESERRPGRLCGLGRWHGLADLEIPASRRRHGHDGRAAFHQVLGGILGSRWLRRLLQPLSLAHQWQGQ
jgi:hypothetical protein